MEKLKLGTQNDPHYLQVSVLSPDTARWGLSLEQPTESPVLGVGYGFPFKLHILLRTRKMARGAWKTELIPDLACIDSKNITVPSVWVGHLLGLVVQLFLQLCNLGLQSGNGGLVFGLDSTLHLLQLGLELLVLAF